VLSLEPAGYEIKSLDQSSPRPSAATRRAFVAAESVTTVAGTFNDRRREMVAQALHRQ